jgi:hypothetical protein
VAGDVNFLPRGALADEQPVPPDIIRDLLRLPETPGVLELAAIVA